MLFVEFVKWMRILHHVGSIFSLHKVALCSGTILLKYGSWRTAFDETVKGLFQGHGEMNNKVQRCISNYNHSFCWSLGLGDSSCKDKKICYLTRTRLSCLTVSILTPTSVCYIHWIKTPARWRPTLTGKEWKRGRCRVILGPVSISEKTSFRKIS